MNEAMYEKVNEISMVIVLKHFHSTCVYTNDLKYKMLPLVYNLTDNFGNMILLSREINKVTFYDSTIMMIPAKIRMKSI